MNNAASALGKLAKGKPKKFSKAEIQRRRERMIALNKKRARLKKEELRYGAVNPPY